MGSSHSAVGEDSTLAGRDFVVYPEDAGSKVFRNVCNNFQSTRPHIPPKLQFFLSCVCFAYDNVMTQLTF